MALQTINEPPHGHMLPNANDSEEYGDSFKTAISKINAMFSELYGSVVQEFVNISDYVVLVGDGVTNNYAAFESFKDMMKTVGASFPATVTMTVASPCVVDWIAHGFRVNEEFRFSTNGVLPIGVTAGTTYYVLSAGLTADTFRFSTKNAALLFNGEGTAINTSGSQSGVHSCRALGVNWQDVLLPPGNYHISQPTNIAGNQRRIRLHAYGAATDNLHFSNRAFASDFTGSTNLSALIQSVQARSSSVTLIDSSKASIFPVGSWVCLAALDLQDPFGVQQTTPPNNHYNEFAKIADVNAGTGVVTFETRLRNSYKSTYPVFWEGSVSLYSGAGAATMFPMNSTWDMDVEVLGLRSINESGGPGGGALICSVRKIKFIDCVFNADGPIPSSNKEFLAERCIWGIDRPIHLGGIEVDKLIESATYVDCIIYSLFVQSTAIDRLTVDGGVVQFLSGTARNTHISNCDISELDVGPLCFGATESLVIENTRIGTIQSSSRFDDALGISAFNNCVSNFTFSSGTLKQPISTTNANWWAVPGRKMFVNDMADVNANMGSPFTVLDVYKDGSGNFCIDTDLASLPVGNSTSATMTMTIASPCVVTWISHGLTAGTPIRFKTSANGLPTGVSASTLYYVLAAGLATDTFRFSTSAGGSAVNSSGSQSGTHTGVSNPLHFQPHPCPRVTVKNCTGCAAIVDLSNGPDNAPLNSYASRRYAGCIGTNSIFADRPYVWGTLKTLTINVIRAYTGVAVTFTRTFMATAFDTDLLASNLSQIVNLKVAGLRTVTPAGATGAQSGDTIASFGSWISGFVTAVDSSDATDSLEKMPIVEMTIETDQGITKSMVGEFMGPTQSHPVLIVDTQSPSLG